MTWLWNGWIVRIRADPTFLPLVTASPLFAERSSPVLRIGDILRTGTLFHLAIATGGLSSALVVNPPGPKTLRNTRDRLPPTSTRNAPIAEVNIHTGNLRNPLVPFCPASTALNISRCFGNMVAAGMMNFSIGAPLPGANTCTPAAGLHRRVSELNRSVIRGIGSRTPLIRPGTTGKWTSADLKPSGPFPPANGPWFPFRERRHALRQGRLPPKHRRKQTGIR